ncbi:hypothetical protein [Pseudoduganella violaceinigra]|uniref:hypothetical protein n=1 Tax=Pseudoduganella violaceinigra TaxID=246602 RepID=UPI00041C32F5|nr:hypothetical protein [Pseudoduganella violaceinigra]
MIIWGSKGEAVVLDAHEHKHCPTCEKERKFLLQLQYKVSHIWYIFKWVSSKQYVRVCEICLRGDRLVAKSVEERFGKPPIPFMSRWSWVFLAALVAGIGVFGSIESSNRSSQVQMFAAAPAKNDIYVLNISSLMKAPESSYMYGVLRVKSVDGNNIEFDAPRVTYNKVTGATKDVDGGKVARPDYFDGSLVLSKADITRLQNEGAIHSIERN